MIQKAAAGGSGTLVPVGTGPFIYSQWQPNSFFTATRNPNYWRKGLPYLDSITFKPIPDTGQRESTLRSGGVDMIESVNPTTITNFSGSGGSGFQLVDTRTGRHRPAHLRLHHAQHGDPADQRPEHPPGAGQGHGPGRGAEDHRRAADQAGHRALPARLALLQQHPLPDLRPGRRPRSWSAPYKAKHGTPTLNLLTIPDPLEIKVVQAIQQMWQQVGFDVTVSEVEQASIIDDFVFGNFQAVTSYQFGAVNPDLNYVWWSTTTISPIGTIGLNFTRMDDPTIEIGHARGPPHDQPGHPGRPPTGPSTSSWPNSCPTCGSSSTSSRRWRPTGSRTSTI